MDNMYFKWDQDLITGNDVVDEQHKGLVETINKVLQLCFSNEEISVVQIEDIYLKLSQYVVKHFEDEEEIMKLNAVDPRHADMHLNLHNEFKDTVSVLFSDISILVNPEKLGEVTEFLIRWLAYHILNTDKSMIRQINFMKNDGLTPAQAFEKEVQNVESSTEPLLKALRALFYLVSDKNKALTLANAQLEEKVQLRTHELVEANKKLEYISMKDELTGLPNRRYALEQIERLISNWNRYQTTFSLLFIDVDKFKGVNDEFGHEYGDKVLKWIADFLKSNIRTSDIPCRLGGDEFLVICSHCNAESAMTLGVKLSETCKTYNLEGLNNCWGPSLSIGVAEIDTTCKTTNDILKKADQAMYLSKKNGGGRATLEKPME